MHMGHSEVLNRDRDAQSPSGAGAGAGAGSSEAQGLAGLLSVQCRVGKARAGAVLEVSDAGEIEVAAQTAPRSQSDNGDSSTADWLARAKEVASEVQALAPARVVPVSPSRGGLYGQPSGPQIVLTAAGQSSGGGKRIEAFLVDPADDRDLQHRVELLELSRALLDLNQARVTANREASKSRRLGQVIETLDATQSVGGFRGTAMALCNELSTRFSAERVSVGFLSGRYVKLAAMSQTEHLNQRMQVVRDIAAAMEECIDQDARVVYPTDPGTPLVNRAAADLSRNHGSERESVVVTVPLRDGLGEPMGGVTLERGASALPTEEELASLGLICDLVAPRLLELKSYDRWFGARWAAASRAQAAKVLSPEHTWAKVAAIAVLAFVSFAFFAKGTNWVESSFVVEPTVARTVPAPWNGYLETVLVEPGDRVTAGETVLGRLDTSEIRLELAQARADAQRYRTEADLAWRDDKQAERAIAQAKARQAEAQVAMYRHRLEQASIVAPLAGVVTQGDLKKHLGQPVEKGQVLFEVAPLDALRAVIHVPEHRIGDVYEGQSGELATASHPGTKLPFVVEDVYPVAELVDQRAVFKAYVRLDDGARESSGSGGEASNTDRRIDWLRPGVEGVAKADAGRASYAWLWTRRAINWVRMELWL